MDAFQILVVILSIVLAVFLLLAIVLTVIIIKLTRDIQAIADDTKTTVRRFARTATNVSNITDPVYLGRFFSKFVDKIKKQ